MASHSIEVRNLRFALDATIPKYWLGNKRAVSTLLDNLSVLFPAGERFFMNSVRAFEHKIRDPQLRAEVRAFYQQEALHGREHVRYNEWSKGNGYPIDVMELRVRKLLDRVAKLPARWQLGVTVALEHFTALLAQMILGDGDGNGYTLQEAHPTMRALWRWHAAEENEHSTVAFDVYQAMGGFYAERTVIMVFTTLIFAAKVLDQQVRMMNADGTLGSASEWRSLGTFLFGEPGFIRKLVRPYLTYYKPGFHPSHLDSSKLLAGWKRDFAAQDEYQKSLAAS